MLPPVEVSVGRRSPGTRLPPCCVSIARLRLPVLEVFAEGSGARVVWTIDLLPHDLAPAIAAMQDQAMAVMKRTFEPKE